MAYFLVIFIPTAFYIIESIIPTKSKVFQKISISFLIIITSLRYGFGADYFTYSDAYYRIANGIKTDAFEPGYIFINKVIGLMGFHFNFLLFIVAIFNYVLLYLSIEENSKRYKWLSLFLFLIYFDLFFYSLSAIRQSIVVSIFLYASKFIKHKQPIKFILWMGFGSLFHWTGILLTVVYFAYNKCRQYGFKRLSTIAVAGVLTYGFFNQFIIELRPYVNKKIEYYLFIYDSGINSSLISAFICTIFMFIWIYMCTKVKIICNNDLNKDLCRRNNNGEISLAMFMIIIFLGLKVMQYTHYYSVIPRFQMYFYSFYIFAIPEIVQIIKSKERYIVIIIIIYLMSVFFVYRYYTVNEYASMYYRTFKLIFE